MSYHHIQQKLDAGQTIILDGGTGTDIQRRGAPMNGDTWCADVNGTHLHIVQAVHEDYVRAGADVITANTFATSALSFNCYGRDGDVVRLDQLAVSAAKAAAAGKPVAVAGSVSTMRPVIRGTDRSDLSVNWSESEAKDLFARKVGNLVACGVDMFMMEMMRDVDYSLWASEVAIASGLPTWIGMSVERDAQGELRGFGRADQRLADFAPALCALKPAAVCIMHSSPDVTGEAIEIVRQSWSGPIGAYPECGYFKSPDWVFTDITGDELVSAARGWQKQSASIFGGCCGIGPSHIEALHREFAA
jgi:S-methylmethionine-dependent homocysteine/selenocysteine methylase